MKPDHEINGRYFVEKKIIEAIGEKYVVSSDNNIFMFPHETDQSLPLGKCFVELEKFYGVGNNSVAYEIKLDQSGKAVVLTELPKENSFPCMSDDGECEKQCDCCKFVENGIKNKQSDDEFLNNEIMSILDEGEQGEWSFRCDHVENNVCQEYCNGHCIEFIKLKNQITQIVKEYHRVKSEGLFTKEDMIDFVNWVMDNPFATEYTFNQWLESKNK